MVILINTVKAFNKTAHLFLRKILRKPSSEKNVDKRNEKRRSLRTSGGRKMEKNKNMGKYNILSLSF